MNTFNDDRHDESDELTELLNDLPQVDPPASLAGTVMSTITQRATTPATQPRVNFTMRRDGTMAKKVLWSVAGLAAVALVALRFVGFPPVESGTEATIGAAQRYQAPQVAAADVKVEDQQFQTFLQSDLFRQLTNDKAAREALKNENLQRALTDAKVRAVLVQPEIRHLISNNAAFFAKNLVKADIIAHLKLDAKTQIALEAAFEASPAFLVAIGNVNVADAIANSKLGLVLANSDAALAISNRAVLDAMFNASQTGAAFDASTNVSNNIVNR
jgi:hypothetical protein